MPTTKRSIPAFDEKKYRKVFASIRKELQRSRAAIEATARFEILSSYWHIGKVLSAELDMGGPRNPHNHVFLKRLAADMGYSDTSFLYGAAKFFNYYPTLPDGRLSWSHYIVLITINDPRERRRVEAYCRARDFNCKQLRYHVKTHRAALQLSRLAESGKDHPVLAFERGSLYTYSLYAPPKEAPTEREGFLDLGFGIEHKVPVPRSYKRNSNCVVVVKDGARYHLRINSNKRDSRYFYSARVKRVIDGDTLIARIDLGFAMWIETTLRLRGIDAPERYTGLGRLVLNHVKSELSECPLVVARTYKTEKFGRYLADIFYMKGEPDPARVAQHGIFLNQDLLERHYANLYQG
jgi:hypothetical protein